MCGNAYGIFNGNKLTKRILTSDFKVSFQDKLFCNTFVSFEINSILEIWDAYFYSSLLPSSTSHKHSRNIFIKWFIFRALSYFKLLRFISFENKNILKTSAIKSEKGVLRGSDLPLLFFFLWRTRHDSKAQS